MVDCKSQNTKKDLCITSEQLTEQWKKRMLRNGAYYIKMLGGDILPAFCNTEYILKQFQTMKGIYDDVAEVLAPVPSYEEWQAKLEENARLKKQINHVLRTQARQFVDNQKLQVKAEKAKDVVNIDTARQIKQLKELLKELELWFTGMVGNMNDKNVGEHNKSVPIGNFEHIFKVFSQKIDEVLK